MKGRNWGIRKGRSGGEERRGEAVKELVVPRVPIVFFFLLCYIKLHSTPHCLVELNTRFLFKGEAPSLVVNLTVFLELCFLNVNYKGCNYKGRMR